MESNDLSKRFPNLTSTQIGNLAEFGQSIIGISGLKSLSSNLTVLVKTILVSESSGIEAIRYSVSDLVSVIQCVLDFDAKCLEDHNTLFGSTGITFEDEKFYLSKRENL